MDDIRRFWDDASFGHKAGLVLGLLGFFASMSSSQATTVNGQIVECTHTDAAAFFVAIVVAICAGVGLFGTSQMSRQRKGLLAMALLVLAGVHTLRGFGILMGGC